MAAANARPLIQDQGRLREVGTGDIVNITDAAESTTTVPLPFTVSTAGDTTLITPPSGKKIRLRRLGPTMSDPDGSANPLLQLKLGALELYRGYVLSGRFDITGATDAALVLTLSKAGSVSGTVYYEVTT